MRMSNNASVCGCHTPLTPRLSLRPTSVDVGSASLTIGSFITSGHTSKLSLPGTLVLHHSHHSMKASPRDALDNALQDHPEIHLVTDQVIGIAESKVHGVASRTESKVKCHSVHQHR